MRGARRLTVSLVAAFLLFGLLPGSSGFTATGPTAVLASAATSPSTTSAASLYLSNWQNVMAIWMASQLNQNDHGTYGPRIGELHYSANWSTNQIVDYSGFFRDETDGVKYDQIHNFASSAYLDEQGTLHGQYGAYSGQTLPIQTSRDFVLVPNEPFLVVRYTFTNPTSQSYTWNLLDQVHLNNTQASSNVNVDGSYDSGRNALFADMTPAGQYVVFLGAFQGATTYQVGNDSDCTATDVTASAWCQFDASGGLADNGQLSVPNLDLGFENQFTLAPSSTTTLYYYLGIQSTISAAQQAADTARAQTGSYWFQTTATDYSNWLNGGKTVSTSDGGVNTAFLRNLVVMKNAQNPTNGEFPATTNPASYGYKAWVRDSSFDAMALDAAGHYPEAAQWWNWMASVQQTNGTWHTTYDLWTGNYVSFVEPEYDSLGEFLVGVYRHWQLTGDTNFLNGVWPQVQAAANFVMNNIQTDGLGPADASIWEETQEYNAFTQAFYAAGLRAAAYLAQAQSNGALADSWNGAASTILSAIQRSYSWSPPGLYNDATQYYDRSVTTGNNPRSLIDSSSTALIVLGDVNAASARAAHHMAVVEKALTHDTWGIARYQGDTYYYTSPYSPAGDEAGAAEPVWPNMTMFVALYEMYTGQMANAFSRLQWYVSRSGVGYMPPGEAVSWVTQQPIVSTMSEPFTAASFLIAALTYTGQYDPRVVPLNANASAYATVNVTTTPSSDWPQWREIPYYDGQPADSGSGSAMTDVARVYMSNDASNIYLRIDNASGAFSAFNTAPEFAVLVYAQDFNHSSSLSSSSTAFYGASLDHPMNYLVARWSNSTSYSHFTANSSGGWSWDYNLTTIAPQWDPATGRLEMVIPISAVASSGSAAAGSWAYVDVELAYQNPSTGVWQDDDIDGLHYDLAASGQAWLYGNTLGHEILNVSTDQARYAPGTPVQVRVDLVNPQVVALSGATLTLHFSHLGASTAPDQSASVSLGPGQPQRYTFSWSPPTTDHQGYFVQAVLTDTNGNVLDTSQTAVDVSSDWSYFPRYGFVSAYGDNYSSALIASRLNDYHINLVQFYDWQWKHHWPLSGTVSAPSASWQDVANRTNYRHTVLDLLSAAHGYGMAGMNYNLLYGAWNGYGQDGSGVDYHWGLWTQTNCTSQDYYALPSGWQASDIYLFNPGDSNWQSYIFGRESDAFAAYPFDGWQVDQLGARGQQDYTCGGSPVDIASTFSGFLSNAASSLNKALVFNAVGQYGQQQVAANPSLAFLYTECWPADGQTTYDDLQTTIQNNSTWSSGAKQSVLAAYMDFAYAGNFSDSAPGFFNDPGVLLTDAAIFASGGDHIELGDVDHMLSNYYYPDEHLLMDANLQRAVQADYNFMTAYENLLRDGLNTSSNAVALPGVSTSTNGQAGTVWTFVKSKPGTDVLQLINLLGNSSADWTDTNASYPAPPVLTNVTVKYYYGTGAPSQVWLASPDFDGGLAHSLSFTTGSDANGAYVQFTLPALDYWDMVWINK